MLVSTLLQRVNYALRGIDDVTPSENSDEASYWLSVANQKKDEWARDSFEQWNSLFSERTLTTPIAANIQSYVVPADFIAPSDHIKIVNNGITYTLGIVPPELREYGKAYISGKNLVLTEVISADSPFVGGSIVLPGYWIPSDMSNFSDEVPVDDPSWLVYAVASEIAFSDVSYEDKAVDIQAKANERYAAMKQNNLRGTATNPLIIQTNVRRIRSK